RPQLRRGEGGQVLPAQPARAEEDDGRAGRRGRGGVVAVLRGAERGAGDGQDEGSDECHREQDQARARDGVPTTPHRGSLRGGPDVDRWLARLRWVRTACTDAEES